MSQCQDSDKDPKEAELVNELSFIEQHKVDELEDCGGWEHWEEFRIGNRRQKDTGSRGLSKAS